MVCQGHITTFVLVSYPARCTYKLFQGKSDRSSLREHIQLGMNDADMEVLLVNAYFVMCLH